MFTIGIPVAQWSLKLLWSSILPYCNTPQAFSDCLIKVGSQMGMSIAQPGYVKYLREQEIPQVCQELLTKCAGAPIDLVYCILPQGEFRSIFFVFG